MLHAEIHIGKVEYEESFVRLFPDALKLKDENRKHLLSLVEKVLREKGVLLQLAEVSFAQAQGAANAPVTGQEKEAVREPLFSEEIEERILDAVAEYLKSLLPR